MRKENTKSNDIDPDFDKLFDELWPLCRSITGEGLRKSLDILSKEVPFKTFSKKTGEKIYDWKVPKEWIIRNAFLVGPNGEKYCDFQKTNLSIVNYSIPVNNYFEFEELEKHIYTLPNLPTAIPYVTSYYQPNWGFCMSHEVFERLPREGKYHCFIDSNHIDGFLDYCHYFLNGGLSKKEILLSSYLCHPSLANNELSGPLVLAGLYKRINSWKTRRFNYRFYLGPETIGSLCFLSDFGKHLINHNILGLVLTCLGGKNKNLSIKLPRNNESFSYQYLSSIKDFQKRPFEPTGGSDERQFCSPGFNLPVANICRDVYGSGYVGYHNSLDTKEFMGIDSIKKSVDRIEQLLLEFEMNYPFERYEPFGEPQLGKRGLYPNINSKFTWETSTDEVFDGRELRNSLMWVLSYSDGKHSLEKISSISSCSINSLKQACKLLMDKKLIF